MSSGEEHDAPMPEPGTAEDGENTPKTVLQPRNPGEALKVATTVLRRRDRNLAAAAERAAKVAKVRREKQKYEKGKIKIVRAEKFVKNARTMQRDHNRLKHLKKKTPKWPNLKADNRAPKCIALLRNSRPGGSKEVKATLRYLNLKRRNHLVILRNSDANKRRLQIIRPFVYWGPISFKTCFNLVHKKAQFHPPGDDAEKIVLSDNVMIEKHLGEFGCLCTEDLAQCLHSCGKHFNKVRRRLWAFEMDETRFASGMVRDQVWTFGEKKTEMDGLVGALMGL